MSKGNSHKRNGNPVLIFACSGAADVGAITDKAARTMAQQGIGKMFCLAGIGGRVDGIVKATKSADKILAIDGCPMNCTKRCLEQAGFNTSYFPKKINKDKMNNKNVAMVQFEELFFDFRNETGKEINYWLDYFSKDKQHSYTNNYFVSLARFIPDIGVMVWGKHS